MTAKNVSVKAAMNALADMFVNSSKCTDLVNMQTSYEYIKKNFKWAFMDFLNDTEMVLISPPKSG